jgi:D-3-phosphoglycerate dehydrogenase / 2-oxoglutarate reductase
MKILLLENIHESAHRVFEAAGYHVQAAPKALGGAELVQAMADVHVLGIRSKTQVTREALEGAKRLLTLGCFCIGTNQVDVTAANGRGVPVFNAPFSNTRSVAELVIGEVIGLSRQLYQRSREVHQGQWKKSAQGSHEIRGKTIGIVGYGHIGSQVGVLAEAMGMRVVFFDTATKLALGNNQRLESLAEVLRVADFVTMHVPETPSTKGMIGKAELARMKRGSFLLNLSRGTVVDIPALAAAVREKHLGGAAIDVYPEEPESNSDGFRSDLQGLENVILTPHVGGSTGEAQEAIGAEVATSLVRFIDTGATTGAVNFPQVELPPDTSAHRILNVHRNVPGVLRDVNRIVSDLHANIRAQVLATDANIGYLVMDLDKNVSDDVKKAISALSTNIKTRILY